MTVKFDKPSLNIRAELKKLNGKLDKSGKAADSHQLDGLGSEKFIRSDVDSILSAKLTVNNFHVQSNGLWDQHGFRLSGTAPSIYFNQTDGRNAFIGVNGDKFYLLADTDSNGSYESPFPLEIDINGGTAIKTFGNTVWHAGNDGAGSTMDSDLLDGLHATSFVRTDADSTIATNTLSFGSQTRQMVNLWSTAYGMGVQSSTAYIRTGGRFSVHAGGSHNDGENNAGGGTNIFTVNSSEMRHNGVRVLTDSYKPSADKWTTARIITLSGDTAGSVSLDGSANVTLTTNTKTLTIRDARNDGDVTPVNLPNYQASFTFTDDIPSGYTWNSVLNVKGWNGSAYAAWQLVGPADTTVDDNLYFRSGVNTTWNGLRKIWHDGNDGTGSGMDADLLDGLHASSFLRSDTNTTLNGGLIIEGNIDSGGGNMGFYESVGTNLILKGDSNGRSGIFFQSEKNGTNINHGSDYGFIQFHAHGFGGTTGEANQLVIGVANDSTDEVILQSPYNGGVKVGYRDFSSGTGLTTAKVYHDNYHPAADKWTTARTLTLTGNVTGSVSFDGSGNISLNTTVGNDSHTHNVVRSKGVQLPTATRDTVDSGVYTFNTHSASLGDSTPTAYWSVLGFGRASAGQAELAAEWTGGGNHLWYRSLRDVTDNWYSWKRIYTDNYHPDADALGGLPRSGSATASTIAERNTSGDIYARLFRCTFADQNSVPSGATIMMRQSPTDDYIRPITAAAFMGWLKNYDGSGSGLDAELLGGLSSSQFVRADVSGTLAGTLTLNGNLLLNQGAAAGQNSLIELGINRVGDAAAYVDFHAAAGADFNGRILRGSGANGRFDFQQTGTAPFFFSGGTVCIGTTDETPGVVNISQGVAIHQSGQINSGRAGVAMSLSRSGSDGQIVQYRREGNMAGAVVVTASSTTYNTSSDYRLKTNVVPLTNASERLLALKPSNFEFKAAPGIIIDGFLAHEVQDIIPGAVHGEKDGIDPETGEPEYQSIDHSTMVPLLTAALQDAFKKIEELEVRIGKLEAK